MKDKSPEQHQPVPDVASKIKNLRKSLALSLDELALRSSVSKSMISQIEGHKTNPTLAMIWKIAKGLETNVQNLIGENSEAVTPEGEPAAGSNSGGFGRDNSVHFTHTPREDFAQITADRPGIHFRVLTPMELAEDLEIYRISILPGSRLESAPHSEGTEEFLTLLSGTLEVASGTNRAAMKAGDFMTYRADQKHFMENSGSENAEIHLVVRFRQP